MSRFELPTVRTKRDARLVELHLELQAMICNRLSYIDLHQLSCVNRFYRALVTKDFMRSCFTDAQWDTELRAVCRDCQRHAPLGGRVIAYTWEAFENPLGGYCTVCSLQGGRLREISSVWAYGDGLACQTPICLWCGWPTWTEEMLHDACASKYERGRIICMCLTWLRSGLSLSAYGLLWRHFRSRETVIPTVFAFLLSCCLNTAFVYGDEAKRKKLLLFFAVEFIVLCLWIPPLYSIAKIVRDKPDNDSIDVAVALLVLITVNMSLRLASVSGNIVYRLGYRPAARYLPRVPAWRQFTNLIMAGIIIWTTHYYLNEPWDGQVEVILYPIIWVYDKFAIYTSAGAGTRSQLAVRRIL